MREELDLYIRARYSLLWVVTSEEQRALQELDSLAQAQRKPLYIWSATTGIVNSATPQRADTTKRDPLSLLSAIIDDREAASGYCATSIPFCATIQWCAVCARLPLAWKPAPRRLSSSALC